MLKLKEATAVLLTAVTAISLFTLPADALRDEKPLDSKASYTEGEAIIVMKDGRSVSSLSVKDSINKSLTHSGSALPEAVLISDKSRTAEELINEARQDPDVLYAFPNYHTEAAAVDGYSYNGLQWHIHNTGQHGGTAGWDIAPEQLWEAASYSSEESVVALIDSGLDINHDSLKNHLWTNTFKELPGYGMCGYDFTNTTAGNAPLDDINHGTGVAGVVVSSAENESGINGVNRGNVRLMALKALAAREFEVDCVFQALDYVLQAKKLGVNIKAVNMSLIIWGDKELKDYLDSFFDELGSLGIVTCCAAGNSGMYLDFTHDEFYQLPAQCESKYCLTVGATDENGKLADFSNYGPCVDIAAPGKNILSAYRPLKFIPQAYSEPERNAYSAEYQSYEGKVTDNSFGKLSPVTDVQLKKNLSLNTKVSVSYDGRPFGIGSKSARIDLSDSTYDCDENGDYYFAVETPFKINDIHSSYYVSFSINGYNYFEYAAMDLPADYKTRKKYPIKVNKYEAWNPEYNWVCRQFQSTDTNSNYDRDTAERMLVIVFKTYSPYLSVDIDDLAVSVENLPEDKLKGYYVSSGTSLASPCVAGAAALISNADPSLSAEEIIEIIKTKSRRSEALEDLIETSRVLSLDNTGIKANTDVLCGDVNLDGTVDAKDRIKLTRHLAKWSGYGSVPKKAADVNLDDTVDAKDRIVITRYLAKWDGYSRLPKK